MSIPVVSWGLASVLAGSFTVCALLILTQRWHGKHSLDHDLSGAQKVHQAPVPRIGGLGLIIGLSAGAIVGFLLDGVNHALIIQLLICAAPAFGAGFIEDLTKSVSVKARLNASFISAALAAWLLNASLQRLDTPVLDTWMAIGPISLLFTCFAVGGMTNAVNIIDGLNGLAAGCVALMLSGLAAIAWQVGDITVMKLCLWGIAALIGFMLLNFPFGRIFLGDGGAYLAGFWLAECGILLLNRNPEVSTWAVLLCCIYPVWETVFSIYRRHIVHRVNSGRPDMIHLHHLVYKHVTRKQLAPFSPTWLKHGVSSAILWMATVACPLVAALAYDQTSVLMLSCLVFVMLYQFAYKSIRNSLESPSHGTKAVVQVERS